MRRPVVVLGAVAFLLFAAGPASAAPPAEVSGQLTDEAGVLGEGAADAQAAVEELAEETDVGVYAVFVDSFDSADAGAWAEDTAQLSELEDSDILLAVAVDDETYEYGYWISDSFPVSAVDLDAAVTDEVQPLLDAGDWSGAVVALAEQLGLSEADDSGIPVWSTTRTIAVVIGIVVVLLAAHLFSRRRGSEPALPARAGE